MDNMEAEHQKQQQAGGDEVKAKENVKFSSDDTFTTDDGGEKSVNEEHIKEAKKIATPAFCKRRQATRHLVVQSPTDHIFSPCSQKLLHKRRTELPKDD